MAASHFEVDIDPASVDSQDKDRDQTLRGPDFFDVAHYPKAHYAVRGFTLAGKNYRGAGALSLRGVTGNVPIDFSFTTAAGGATLEGTALLKRLQFGVGQGDWKSTEMVGDDAENPLRLAADVGRRSLADLQRRPMQPPGTSKT